MTDKGPMPPQTERPNRSEPGYLLLATKDSPQMHAARIRVDTITKVIVNTYGDILICDKHDHRIVTAYTHPEWWYELMAHVDNGLYPPVAPDPSCVANEVTDE